MYLENLLQAYNQLSPLDPLKWTFIIYNRRWHDLTYMQDGKIIRVISLSGYFTPNNKTNYYLLSPSDLKNLMTGLLDLITNYQLRDETTLIHPKELEFTLYKSQISNLQPYPVQVKNLKLASIVHPTLVKLACSFIYNKFNNPLTFYLKNEKENSSQSN